MNNAAPSGEFPLSAYILSVKTNGPIPLSAQIFSHASWGIAKKLWSSFWLKTFHLTYIHLVASLLEVCKRGVRVFV